MLPVGKPEDDPRFAAGAYVTDGKELYDVMGVLVLKVKPDADAEERSVLYVRVMNSKTHVSYRLSVKWALEKLELVLAAPRLRVPDAVPDVVSQDA